MQQLVKEVENQFRKSKIAAVRSGDVVRVSQRIKEGSKERVQVFEGLVIRTDRLQSLSARITVRRIASGVGVEKSFLLHSPLVEKVEVIKRSKVRRNYLSFMRARSGKSTRLAGVYFDKDDVNVSVDEQIDKAVGKVEEEKSSLKEAKEEPKAEAAKTDEPDKAKTEDKTPVESEKTDTEAAETTAKSSDEKPEAEAKPVAEKMSKEEKSKLKKAKAEAFRQAREK